MKTMVFLVVLLYSSTASFSQWAIGNVEAFPLDKASRSAMRPKATDDHAKTNAVPEDFFLAVTLHNVSSDIQYVRGIRDGGSFYMVEAFIKNPGRTVWERENTWVDRKLEMLPVKPGAEVKTVRRVSGKHTGCAMMLSFVTAHSEHDQRGSEILIGPFEIPNPPKSEPDGAANGSQPFRSETNTTSSAAGSRR